MAGAASRNAATRGAAPQHGPQRPRPQTTTCAGRLPLLLLLLICSGCQLNEWAHNRFRVGPNYCKPPVPVSSGWIDKNDPQVVSQQADLAQWWTVFNDPMLDSLVQTAYRQNISLREAGARILQARYRRQIAAGFMFPQSQDVEGLFSSNKISEKTAFVPPDLWFRQWDTTFNASWELDFWGRYRRAIEAADADLDASVENYDDILVILLADVSSSYVEYRTFQARLQFARENVQAQEEALRIAEEKFRYGAATERDVQQAKTVLEETRALVPLLEAGQRVSANRLCVLLGVPPYDLEAQLREMPIPTAGPEVVVGIPADLVRRRPDVRRAERELAAQSARIGIATSDLYPHISLVGSIGVSAENFDDLFDGQRSMLGAVGPGFRWDVLNYGRLLNNIRAEDAQFQELVYAYQQRVLEAGREAEDALVTYLRSQQRVRSLQASAQAAQRTLEITTDQYKQGAVEFTAVFLAASALATQQDAWAQGQGALAQSLVALYRALGGGWEMRLTAPAVADVSSTVVPLPAVEAEPAAEETDAADGPLATPDVELLPPVPEPTP